MDGFYLMNLKLEIILKMRLILMIQFVQKIKMDIEIVNLLPKFAIPVKNVWMPIFL